MNTKIALVYSWQVAAWITAFEYTISTLLVDEFPQFGLVQGEWDNGIVWVNKR